MAEMDAFERQVADVARRVVGPPRPIDAIAIARRVGTRTPVLGSRRLFGALRFVAAGAIVALFAGMLLVGFPMTPSVERAMPGSVASGEPTKSPAVERTASPSPSPERSTRDDLLPGVSLVTEEVEPGVFHVISDGIRELAWDMDWVGPFHTKVITGPPGTVILRTTGGEEVYRLGRGAMPEMVGRDPLFASDGRIWAIGPRKNRRLGALERYDGGTWTPIRERAAAFALAADGTLWVVWERPARAACEEVGPRDSCGLALGTIEGDRSRETLRHVLGDGGEGDIANNFASIDELWATPRGVWLQVNKARDMLYRVDGKRITAVDLPADFWHGGMGSGGAYWARLDRDRLARFDGTSWTTFDQSDGVPPLRTDVRGEGDGGLQTVDPDGSVWLSADTIEQGSGSQRCDGVDHFDGERLRRYLAGTCVYSVTFAPNGSVWVTAVDRMRDGVFVRHPKSEALPLGLYVISPEAAMAR